MEGIDQRHLEETKNSINDINARTHTPVPINKSCLITRLQVKGEPMGQKMRGKFIEVYPSFLVFEFENGIRECFRKNDINIDWRVVGQKKISQGI